MTRTAKPPVPRQPYEPPRVRRIKLVPDEVAVAGCKSNMVGAQVCRRGGVLVNRFRGS